LPGQGKGPALFSFRFRACDASLHTERYVYAVRL
jgi:hypothetical protein